MGPAGQVGHKSQVCHAGHEGHALNAVHVCQGGHGGHALNAVHVYHAGHVDPGSHTGYGGFTGPVSLSMAKAGPH